MYSKEKKQIELFENNMKRYLLTSRFNNVFIEMNKKYREEHNIHGIYGSPIEICKKIKYNSQCFVLEMNNDTNKIIAIGLIKNYPHYSKHKIYNDRNDRYTYICIQRKEISPTAIHAHAKIKTTIDVLEELCFYGNEHLKRGNGLQQFPTKYLYRLENELNIIQNIQDFFEMEE